ncbi:helicase-primase subunit [Felid alphaherpesvirus 1]|uniref:Helicase-primase subunit n=2 Tax=Feline herpesvirus 1 TaxID=10334 RepID=D1FXX4_FHV1|nr:helicase-primase subunit [Felid alphaherpesvirus 1]AMN88984.1 helicase-primase subunit [synthetic construct]ACT88350.1 helicase-primase subunit [Felid alphaherpesvirus 1]ALJ84070.1 helicase-primase subunit [Felid alphaherpesvirus 1]ALJ84146.1 helicase-primase subunit [Felid alphaherpesvirus 1]ALJ84222.1 helicase-primase subunit [Felid alphaherpesvirus 1]
MTAIGLSNSPPVIPIEDIMDDHRTPIDDIKWTHGYVCAASLYSLWIDHDKLNALVYLICNEDGEYTARFTVVSVSENQLIWGSRECPYITIRKAAAAAGEAAAPNIWPLGALGQTVLWKAIYSSVMAVLKRSFKGFSFYSRVAFCMNIKTGMTVDIQPILNDKRTNSLEPEANPVPVPAILNVTAKVDLDPGAIKANSMNTEGGGLARARLCTLRDGYFSQSMEEDISMDVEVITKRHTFRRRYDSIQRPAVKQTGDFKDLFKIIDSRLVLQSKTVMVRVLIPRYFDCFLVCSSTFSIISIMTLYKQWRETMFSNTGELGSIPILLPIFAYIGPELSPTGEDRDYSCMLGFPGIPLIKVASPDVEAVREAIDVYVSTDGMWPAMGMLAFHLLAPWDPTTDDVKRSHTTRLIHLESKLTKDQDDKWPAGRISSILDHPIAMKGLWLAKFDFSAFFPSLYLAIFPEHTRLAQIISARIRREKGGLKAALVSLFGGLQHIQPLAYRVIIGLANGISRHLERLLNNEQFGICTYIKDGFWGVFGSLTQETTSLADVEIAAENIRNTCQMAAIKYLEDMGLVLPEGTNLHLRLEGIYTDVMSWTTNSYWLWNRETDMEAFVGFPTRSAICRAMKNRLSMLLRMSARMGCYADLEALLSKAREMCDELLELSYMKRWDFEFWSVPMNIENRHNKLPNAIYCGGSVLDRDHRPRECVPVKNHDHEVIQIPWKLYPHPAIIPQIDCYSKLEPLFGKFSTMLNRSIEAYYDTSETKPVFSYPISEYTFLFS